MCALKKHLLLAALATLLVLFGARAARADSAGTITADGVNFRSRASTSGAILDVLYKGDSVAVLGTSGNWYKVTFEGTSGYVFKSYVGVTAPAAPSNPGLLKRGSTGSAVKQLQQDLILLSYLGGGADGIYGAKTEAAVKQYQTRNGLTVDGKAGSQTKTKVGAEASLVNTVVGTAKQYLGTDYVYGGSTPETGFDCSGLVQYAHLAAGLTTPRVSYEQAASGVKVPKSQMRAGDVVCFNSPVSHVGIYLGGGKFIHAPKTGDVVKITSVSAMDLTAIRRYTGNLAR